MSRGLRVVHQDRQATVSVDHPATTASMRSASVTSHCSATASPPRRTISSAVSTTFDSVRPTTATRAPSAASARAIPRPIP